MTLKDFMRSKLKLFSAQAQGGKQAFFESVISDIESYSRNRTKKVRIPADGKGFSAAFNAYPQGNNRLVITATRIKDGFEPTPYDRNEMFYVVQFENTRAAYLRGYYSKDRRLDGLPYIHWDIRSYIVWQANQKKRIYVDNFYPKAELVRMILAMENLYNVGNIVNSYVGDRLGSFQRALKGGSTPRKIEEFWAQGTWQSLGYRYAELLNNNFPNEVAVHWCKDSRDLQGTKTQSTTLGWTRII